MANQIRIIGPARLRKHQGPVINTCQNNATNWLRDINPFLIGPVPLPDGTEARIFENAWQFAKVYADQADADGNPTAAWTTWARAGWDDPKGRRYPRGRGARPLYSWWCGERLGYIEARRRIYFPLYRDAVRDSEGFQRLRRLHEADDLTLFDWDGYDAGDATPGEILRNPKRKMGHSFVLKAMLLLGPGIEPDDLP